MRTTRLLASLAFLLLPACGGENGSGPTQPQHANIGGTWDFAISNLSATVNGIGISCSFSREINILQSGTTFSGTADPGLLSCQAGAATASTLFGSEPIVSGTVNGNNVAFDFSTSDFHHAGTVSGNSMSGNATYRVDLGGTIGVVNMTGSWGASRLSGSASAGRADSNSALGEVLPTILRQRLK